MNDTSKSKSKPKHPFNKKEKNFQRKKTYDRRDRFSKNTSSTDNTYESKSNPIEWYNKYPQLLEATARIAFPYRPGMHFPTGTTSSGTNYSYIPSVFTINYIPTVGQSSDNQSPISQVAKEIYGKVRASFSSELAVDAPDFVMYLMALDNIFANIAFMKRVYRIVNSYTPDNVAMSDALLFGMGFTTDQILELRTNWIQGWGLINELVNMTKKFRCPAIMDVFNRHYWMNDNVYCDAPTINSQLYMFVPTYFYNYSETAQETGTSLVPFAFTNFIGNWVTMFNTVRGQIEQLSDSSDAYTISGYLMRAFEGVNPFVIDEITQDAKFEPIYDAIVLMQIENAKSIPVLSSSLSITQDPNTNAVLCNPQVDIANFSAQYSEIYPTMNIRSNIPGVPEVVEASRLMTAAGPAITSGTTEYRNILCGTEIVTGFSIVIRYINNSNKPVLYEFNMSTYENVDATATVSALRSRLQILSILSRFDWHPEIQVYNADSVSKYSIVSYWDYFNPTSVTTAILEQIHKVCLYSEFNAFSII